MKTILMTISLLLLFNGCTTKTITITKDRVVCFNFETIVLSAPVEIRVHKDDYELFKVKREELYETISFYEKQNSHFNSKCKELENAE